MLIVVIWFERCSGGCHSTCGQLLSQPNANQIALFNIGVNVNFVPIEKMRNGMKISMQVVQRALGDLFFRHILERSLYTAYIKR